MSKHRWYSWDMAKYKSAFVAAAFALMVLSIFFVLQDYGPESTIRKFHQQIADRQFTNAGAYLDQPVQTPSSQNLIADVSQLLALGARPVVQGMIRRQRLVQVQVVYFIPSGQRVDRLFTVERSSNGQWVIRSTSSGINLLLGSS